MSEQCHDCLLEQSCQIIGEIKDMSNDLTVLTCVLNILTLNNRCKREKFMCTCQLGGYKTRQRWESQSWGHLLRYGSQHLWTHHIPYPCAWKKTASMQHFIHVIMKYNNETYIFCQFIFWSIFTFMHYLNSAGAVYTVWISHGEWTNINGPKVLGKMSSSIDLHSN